MDCIRCQGRLYTQPLRCGKNKCPIFNKVNMFKYKKIKEKTFSGKAPSVFVGRIGYPNLNIGILSTPEFGDESWILDAPTFWGQNTFGSEKIINFRNSLINSRFKVNVKSFNKYLENTQLVSLASKPVDLSINLETKPLYRMKVNDIVMPMGPAAGLKKLRLESNPHIKTKIEKIVSDTNLKSAKGLSILFDKGVNEHDLSKILSLGNLGIKKSRKLVPTRWSITATHDTLGKHLIKNLKHKNQVGFRSYFGDYLGNYYLILTLPDVWSFELFELYLPKTLLNSSQKVKFCTDYEFYSGRKSYAMNCVGGYYNCRFAIAEKLHEIKRQGSIIVLRFITDEYSIPLGSWVCTEATRKALNSKPQKFSSREELLAYAKKLCLDRFKYDISYILEQSKLLNIAKQQKRLNDFLT